MTFYATNVNVGNEPLRVLRIPRYTTDNYYFMLERMPKPSLRFSDYAETEFEYIA